MGKLVHTPLDKIEEILEGMRYGDLEMDDVADILLVLVREVNTMRSKQAVEEAVSAMALRAIARS